MTPTFPQAGWLGSLILSLFARKPEQKKPSLPDPEVPF